eukprot:TRINITY_DN3556_c0_g1_i8.p1 TRINITY_DN3556_c0_g1~~TRINITY_DN3556_c0_g1_i8.p1  ORF type:complete len:480 (-),score=166.39 TRINITY_DN3556_c0_g1_i8:1051-2490(-)
MNATIHPMVNSFMKLGRERIISRYSHLNPNVDVDVLREILSTQCQYFRWAGSDLFNVTTQNGNRQMIVIETNSCPSGQKSFPQMGDNEEGGYGTLVNTAFKDQLEALDTDMGGIAVIYDKNIMEASGYAATIAEITGENVHLTPFYDNDEDPPVHWNDQGIMEIRNTEGEWLPIRIAFRYVTQKPWNRIPMNSKTLVMNPVIACLSGGRNKMMADKSYDFYNSEIANSGLQIRVPETFREVRKNEIPFYFQKMGGHLVIKIPYSNAGQGVYCITSEQELEAFMETESDYDNYIIQSLVGNSSWSSDTKDGRYYHTGTIPDKKNRSFVADLRMMVASTGDGFIPVAVYARKSIAPLIKDLKNNPKGYSSWDMLGTNLSFKTEEGKWDTDTNRLLLMDQKDFNQLGLGIDDLIDAYVQTVLSVVSIERMCQQLLVDGVFQQETFLSLNPDDKLMDEIVAGQWVDPNEKVEETEEEQVTAEE